MTAIWNHRANQLFLEALDYETVEERDTFVARACGSDSELRREVVALLVAHANAKTFLDHPVATLPAVVLDALPSVPTHIGPYQLLKLLGEGGMGMVFHAIQDHPFQRHVAVKIIKPGMDSRQILARFAAERESLARMDHPHIARVLDAGMTEQERPYFVMELVQGESITRFCDQTQVPLRERLELFRDVCLAVQHAHQKGILHRDLKPSNVLVATDNGRPVVKVIDFGIAKAIGDPLSSAVYTTAHEHVIGTPAYMSPEQATAGAVDVDTRSDVYSLGVVLYELLTGTTPFEKKLLAKEGMEEYRRRIREADPPAPSRRICQSEENCRRRADGLGVRPQILLRDLRGELDWIVMRALEKEPERRYESASAFAEDLQRYLRDDSVQASPPSAAYRMRKFLRRYRASLLAATMVASALITGTAIAIWQARDAMAARRLADQHLREAQQATMQVEAARQRAESSALQTRRLLYAGDMRLATYAWQRNDVRRMQELLSRHIPESGHLDLRGFAWGFLSRHSQLRPQELLHSAGPLYVVRRSPQRDQLAVAGATGLVHLLDGQSFSETMRMQSGQLEVNGLDFSPDGTQLVTAGDDGSVAVWDLRTGEPVLRIAAHASAAFQVAFSPDGKQLFSAGKDATVRIWDLPGGQPSWTLDHHAKAIESLAVSSRGDVAIGSADFYASLWSPSRSQLHWKLLDASQSKANVVAFESTGYLLGVGHDSGVALLRVADSGALVAQQEFPDAIHAMAFAPSPKERSQTWLAIGDRGGSIHVLPVDNSGGQSGLSTSQAVRQRAREWAAHTGRVYSLAFGESAGHLLSAGEDGRLLLWNLEPKSLSHILPHDVHEFAIGANQLFLTTTEGVFCYPLSGTETALKAKWPLTGARHVAFAPRTGRILVTDNRHRLLELADPNKAPKVIWEAPENSSVHPLAVSPSGEQAVLEVVDEASGQRTLRVVGGKEYAWDCPHLPHVLIWTADGRSIIHDQNNDLIIRDSRSGDIVRRLSGHESTIWSAAESSDGVHLASGSKDRTSRIWNLETGQQVWSEIAHSQHTEAVAFSPDGEVLATSGGDGMLRLWHWKQGALTLEYPLLDWPVEKLAFSAKGHKLVTQTGIHLRVYDARPETVEE